MTLCIRCISQLFDQYKSFYSYDEDLAAERICQMTDMFFDEIAWGASRKISSESNRMNSYVSKLNLKQSKNRGSTYSDTLINRWEAAEKEAEYEAEIMNKDAQEVLEPSQVDPAIVRRFGLGFVDREYDVLQAEYDSWVERYGEPIDKRQDELYITMCYLKLNLQKSLQNDSAGVGTLANSYKGFIEAATTEIEDRRKREEQEVELDTLGMWVRDIEQYAPAEFYKDKKLYLDFDHLKEYVVRFMGRPLKNLLTGSKEMDEEFSLSESEE